MKTEPIRVGDKFQDSYSEIIWEVAGFLLPFFDPVDRPS